MKRVLLSIWFLALIVPIPIIVFLPPVFDKYKVELISKNQKNMGEVLNPLKEKINLFEKKG